MNEEIIMKRCSKCGRVLPITEFYTHTQMSDGHQSKCKECARADARRHTYEKSQDAVWVEKERARGREKYHRLGYRDKDFNNRTRRELSPNQNARRALIRIGVDMEGKEAHHWNYNRPKSVIILSRKAHHRLHHYISVSREDKFCYTKDGECLDTEEKTMRYYREVFGRYADLNEELEIINF